MELETNRHFNTAIKLRENGKLERNIKRTTASKENC